MTYPKRCLAGMLLVITSVHTLHAGEFSDFFRNVGEDFAYLATSPTRLDTEGALITLGIVGATGILYWQDQNIRRWFRDHRTSTLDNLSPVVEKFGVFGVDLGLLALYGGTGYLIQNEKMKQTALLSLESFLVSGAITVGVKVGVGRSRPDIGEGSRSFKPFSIQGEHMSFPSGHASDAFSIASVFADMHDSPLVGVAAYSLASLVGLQRIYADRHWASDVLVGAALGTVVGKSVVYLHKQKKDSAYVVPIVDPSDGRFGLMLVKRF
jgi:membrane-associated phospholipid phosphatase